MPNGVTPEALLALHCVLRVTNHARRGQTTTPRPNEPLRSPCPLRASSPSQRAAPPSPLRSLASADLRGRRLRRLLLVADGLDDLRERRHEHALELRLGRELRQLAQSVSRLLLVLGLGQQLAHAGLVISKHRSLGTGKNSSRDRDERMRTRAAIAAPTSPTRIFLHHPQDPYAGKDHTDRLPTSTLLLAFALLAEHDATGTRKPRKDSDQNGCARLRTVPAKAALRSRPFSGRFRTRAGVTIVETPHDCVLAQVSDSGEATGPDAK